MDALLILSDTYQSILSRYYSPCVNESNIQRFIMCCKKIENLPCSFVLDKRLYVTVKVNNIRFVAVSNSNTSSLSLRETLYNLASILSQSLGCSLSEDVIMKKYTYVILLIGTAIYKGSPSVFTSDGLNLLVYPKSSFIDIFNKISSFNNIVYVSLIKRGFKNLCQSHFESVDEKSTSSSEDIRNIGTGSGFGLQTGILNAGSSVWWRDGNVNHLLNSMSVSVIEKMTCSYSSNSCDLIHSTLTGSIHVDAKLLGIPLCNINLKNPSVLQNTTSLSYHTCFNVNKWRTDDIISFIPPNGSFVLCSYSINGSKVYPPIEVSTHFLSYYNRNMNMSKNSEDTLPLPKLLISIRPCKRFLDCLQAIGSNENLILGQLFIAISLPSYIENIVTTTNKKGTVQYKSEKNEVEWHFKDYILSTNKNNNTKTECELVLAYKENIILSSTNKNDCDSLNHISPMSNAIQMDPLKLKKNYTNNLKLTTNNQSNNTQLNLSSNRNAEHLFTTVYWVLPNRLVSGLEIDSIEIPSQDSQILNCRKSFKTVGRVNVYD